MPREKFEYVERLNLYRKRIKDADGKYVAIYGKTPTELSEKLKSARRSVEDAQTSKENPFLSDYADRWTELNLASISTASRQDYFYIINTYIKAPLGHRRMKDITPDDIKAAMLTASEKSQSVYGKAVMLYKRIFNSAVESDIILKSPCSGLRRGGKEQKEKHALTAEQSSVLLDAVKGTGAYVFIVIGLYSGMRREEILGLQWDCVCLDDKAPHISVRRAVRWEHNQPVVEERLKSKAAKRDIPIPAQLVSCLSEAKKVSTSDYVIANTTGGPKSETQFRNLWNAVRCRTTKTRTYTEYRANGVKEVRTISPQKGEKAKCRKHCYTIDFDVTPHILRHTYITNLLLAGVDIKTVQYLAGHEKAKVTLDIYAHLTYNQPEDLIAKVNMAFSG
ncbi:MAG: tyrosine-type recombinase/integrase [Oscillospiraceae bacterium]